MAVAFVPDSFASESFGDSTSPRTLAFAADVGAGSLLEVSVASFGVVTVGVTDSLGQTYTQAGDYAANSSTRISKWYFPNSSAGACTVTVTPSGAAYLAIAVAEYTGIAAVSPFNAASAGASGSDSAPSTGDVAVANAGDLVTAAYGQGTTNISTSTVASPFTDRATLLTGGTNIGLGSADDTAAAGTEGAVFATSGSVGWAALAVSYLAGGGAPAADPIGRIVPTNQ